MALAQVSFEKRLRRIVKTHQRLANGVVHRVDENNLITAQPRIYNPRFPLRGLILLMGTAFLFKGYILASLGTTAYSERIADLAQGSLVERAGAWIMQADQVTLAVAQVFQSLGL